MPLDSRAELFMSLSGKVVAADNGAPLTGIRVLLMSKEKGKVAETTSSTTGNYIIRDVPKGNYTIATSVPDPFLAPAREPVTLVVNEGKNVVGANIVLHPAGAAKGRVVLGSNTGLHGQVICDGRAVLVKADGTFFFPNLLPGSYTALVVVPGMATRQINIISIAKQISDVGDVNYLPSEDTSIVGRIRNASGSLVKNSIVVASAANGSFSYAMTNADGAFALLGLNKGQNYKLTVISYGYKPYSINDIAVPTVNLVINIGDPDTETLATTKYYFDRKKMDVEAFYQDILPASVTACQKGSCPDGDWVTVTADLTALIPTGVLGQGGGSFSVGMFICWNSFLRKDYASFCRYFGANTDILTLGVGATAGYCSACCVEDIFESFVF
jgi:hypothetical protein